MSKKSLIKGVSPRYARALWCVDLCTPEDVIEAIKTGRLKISKPSLSNLPYSTAVLDGKSVPNLGVDGLKNVASDLSICNSLQKDSGHSGWLSCKENPPAPSVSDWILVKREMRESGHLEWVDILPGFYNGRNFYICDIGMAQMDDQGEWTPVTDAGETGASIYKCDFADDGQGLSSVAVEWCAFPT